jgi:hypothetical protein
MTIVESWRRYVTTLAAACVKTEPIGSMAKAKYVNIDYATLRLDVLVSGMVGWQNMTAQAFGG